MTGKQFFTHVALTTIIFILFHAAFANFPFYHSSIVKLILYVILLVIIYRQYKRYFGDTQIKSANKAVLITGCDSGFGNLLAKRLDSRGFHVFASCLFPDGTGANSLKQTCSNRLKVLLLDVSSDESVANALKFVKENLGSNVLWTVVNNAATGLGSSVDFSTIQHFKDSMNVNALGPVRVSKTFLPLLKESKGRIVNINSILGRIPIMNQCAYIMSKHAAVAFSECLSLEMNAWGIHVISIEPEGFRTPITDSAMVIRRTKAERCEIDESIISSYGEEYFQKWEKVIAKTFDSITSVNTDIVVDCIESAITEEHPDHVYKPRWSWFSKVLFCLLENAPFSLYEKMILILSMSFQYPIPKDAKM